MSLCKVNDATNAHCRHGDEMKELRLTFAMLLGLLGFVCAFLNIALISWPPRPNPLIPVAIAISFVAVWLSRQSIREFRNDRLRWGYIAAIVSMCLAVPGLLLAIVAPIEKRRSERETDKMLRARLEEMRKEYEQEQASTPPEK